ncbi:hypothetical protein V8D89_005439 [Ganoderma adspersum]
MSSFIATTSGVAQEGNGRISSKLVLAMVGCLLGFTVLVIGFFLVSRKSCCAPRRSDANASLPSYHDSQHVHALPPSTRRGCPVASLRDFQCAHCLKRGGKGHARSSCASLESISLPPPPYPQAAALSPVSSRRSCDPTSWLPRSQSNSAASFTHGHITAPPRATAAILTRPAPPSYHYASRGPVGGPAPRYRQS